MRKVLGPWGKAGLLTLVVGAVLLGLLRFIHPDTPIADAPMALIIVLALVITVFAETMRRRARGNKDGDGKD